MKMKTLPQGEKLDKLAESLGVDTQGEPVTPSERLSSDALLAKRRRVSDYELQERVIAAQRAQRESRLWLVALVSAIASVVSAVTALVALLLTRAL